MWIHIDTIYLLMTLNAVSLCVVLVTELSVSSLSFCTLLCARGEMEANQWHSLDSLIMGFLLESSNENPWENTVQRGEKDKPLLFFFFCLWKQHYKLLAREASKVLLRWHGSSSSSTPAFSGAHSLAFYLWWQQVRGAAAKMASSGNVSEQGACSLARCGNVFPTTVSPAADTTAFWPLGDTMFHSASLIIWLGSSFLMLLTFQQIHLLLCETSVTLAFLFF